MSELIQDSYYIQNDHLYRNGEALFDLHDEIPGHRVTSSSAHLLTPNVLLITIVYHRTDAQGRTATRFLLHHLPWRPGPRGLAFWRTDLWLAASVDWADGRGHIVVSWFVPTGGTIHRRGWVYQAADHTWHEIMSLMPNRALEPSPDGFVSLEKDGVALYPYDGGERKIIRSSIERYHRLIGATSQVVVTTANIVPGTLQTRPRATGLLRLISQASTLSKGSQSAQVLDEAVIWANGGKIYQYLDGKTIVIPVPTEYADAELLHVQRGTEPILIVRGAGQQVAIQGGQVIGRGRASLLIHERPSWRLGQALLHAAVPAALARYIGRAI